MANHGFQNNPNLPRADYKHIYTQWEMDEFIKCAHDPIYFSKNYIKIVNVDKGLCTFDMWNFQEKMLNSFHVNRFTICLCPRQVGKTTTAGAYLLHYILFNHNVSVAILANKAATAREILSRLQLAFEYLPAFLKMGVVEWNKGSLELSNGSKIMADSTSGSSVRGRTFNLILLDEFAHIPLHIAEAFFSSTYPTISSGKTTKVIIVSTPLGMNQFWRLWKDAVDGRNHYVPISVHWSEVPGRDEKWKEETIKNTSEMQFRQEFDCQFLGSTNTLISPTKIQMMLSNIKNPIQSENFLDIYDQPQTNHVYCICADVSEGQNLDYSTFSVIDVTTIPYIQVAKYRNKNITPYLFPTVIYTAARKYNESFILIEINSIGLQVADILHFELGYENLIKVEMKGRQGQQNTFGNKKRIAFGLKNSTQTKRIGCANLKTLIEADKLLVHDIDTIQEFTTFSADKQSFKAEDGMHDDLAMSLVNFGWLTSQRYFKDSIQSNIRQVLQEEQLKLMDQDILPFLVDDGLTDHDDMRDLTAEAAKEAWIKDRGNYTPFDSVQWDILSNKHRL